MDILWWSRRCLALYSWSKNRYAVCSWRVRSTCCVLHTFVQSMLWLPYLLYHRCIACAILVYVSCTTILVYSLRGAHLHGLSATRASVLTKLMLPRWQEFSSHPCWWRTLKNRYGFLLERQSRRFCLSNLTFNNLRGAVLALRLGALHLAFLAVSFKSSINFYSPHFSLLRATLVCILSFDSFQFLLYAVEVRHS